MRRRRSARAEGASADLGPYKGKIAALVAASPGRLGGLRGLVTVRSILGNIGVTVIPEQLALASAHEAFADDGSLRDDNEQKRLGRVAQALVNATRRLATD